MRRYLSTISIMVLFAGISLAQQGEQNKQQNPPLGDQSSYPAATHKMDPAEKNSTPVAQGRTVDLNSGSKKDLAALPGVGPDIAQNIIDARPFSSKEDLLKKKLVPQSTFDQIKDLLTVQGPKKQSMPQ